MGKTDRENILLEDPIKGGYFYAKSAQTGFFAAKRYL